MGGKKMDTNERIRLLMAERGWSEYSLGKEAGLSQSTIANFPPPFSAQAGGRVIPYLNSHQGRVKKVKAENVFAN
jgi:hypothetical protein